MSEATPEFKQQLRTAFDAMQVGQKSRRSSSRFCDIRPGNCTYQNHKELGSIMPPSSSPSL